MKKNLFSLRVFRFYRDGFREMTWGRTLWLIVLIKLFIMFVVLKIFFFPRFLGQFETEEAKQEYVSKELINRANIP